MVPGSFAQQFLGPRVIQFVSLPSDLPKNNSILHVYCRLTNPSPTTAARLNTLIERTTETNHRFSQCAFDFSQSATPMSLITSVSPNRNSFYRAPLSLLVYHSNGDSPCRSRYSVPTLVEMDASVRIDTTLYRGHTSLDPHRLTSNIVHWCT